MHNWQTHKPQLIEGVSQLGIALNDTQLNALLHYLSALSLWNKKFNLTAITVPEQMLIKHVLDSLSLLPHLPDVNKANSLLDVGTGAGLPGLLLAICQPARQHTLLDSNSKRIRFLRQMIAELKLNNVTAVHSRIEDLSATHFDVITSRAFASLLDFVELTQHLLATDGQIIAMKGLLPLDEIKQLESQHLESEHLESQSLEDQPSQKAWQIKNIALKVPFLDENRHLVVLHQINQD